MKRVEKESFLKSFFLFSLSMGGLITVMFYFNYAKSTHLLDENIYSQMRICNLDLKCEKFKIGFAKAHQEEKYILHKNREYLYAHFPILGAKDNVLEVRFSQKNYDNAIWKIKKELLLEYLIIMIFVHIVAAFFSFISLAPLRKSLHLTEEFVKDILHDFNTPLSTLRLNVSMLKREIPQNNKLDRIERSVFSVLELQTHLRAYLNNHKGQKEHFDFATLLKERIALLQKNHPKLHFKTDLNFCELHTNKDAFFRIIDNILSNAVKYNKEAGYVSIVYHKSREVLEISDTGKGIKYPKKVFERFYKEQDRGIGIGLNIVSKLCEELNIKISLESNVGIGTTFYLNIHTLIASNKD